MKHLRLQIRSTVVVIVIALLAAADAGLFADGARVGSTLYPKPIDGTTRMFPHVAYDNANNAYLVVWGIGHVGARFVSASGALLGSPVAVSTTTAGPVRVACASQVNACLLAWIQEPATMMARLVRYNGGSVQFVTSPFAVNQNGVEVLSGYAEARIDP